LLAAASRALKQLSPFLFALSSKIDINIKRSCSAAHPQIFLLTSERHCKLPPMATSCQRWRNLHGRSHSPNGHECVPCPAKSRSSSISRSSSSRSVPMSEGGAVECMQCCDTPLSHSHSLQHTHVTRTSVVCPHTDRQTGMHGIVHWGKQQLTARSIGISQVCF
jgi:hypothetical protein